MMAWRSFLDFIGIRAKTLLTTPRPNIVENDGTNLYYTNNAGTRLPIDLSGGGTGVDSFAGRDGTVVPVAGDYTPVLGGTGQTSYATGDTLYASAANTLSKRTVGNVGDVLTVAGGVPTWAAPSGTPSFSAITAGTNTAALVMGTGGTLDVSGTGQINPVMAAAHSLSYIGRARITSPSDGEVRFTNDAGSGFTRLTLGSAVAAPSIRTIGAALMAITADNAAYVNFTCGSIIAEGNILSSTAGSVMGDSARWRIAGTADGETNIYDSTGAAPAFMLSSFSVLAKTAAYNVTALDSGRTFTDEGAAGVFAFTLPTAVKGYRYTFVRTTANVISITAGAADTIQVEGTTTAAAGSITLGTDGASVTLQAINATEWITIAKTGTVTA